MRVLQGNRTNGRRRKEGEGGGREREREGEGVKKLARVIGGAGKSDIRRAGWSLEIEARYDVAASRQDCFFFGKPQSLLLRPSTD